MIYPFHGRRLSRVIVIETIYNSELLNYNLDKTFEDIVNMRKDYFKEILNEIKKDDIKRMFLSDLENWEKIINFSRELLSAYKLNKEKIEEILKEVIVGKWDYERIFLLEKSILKTAVCEMISFDTPYKVIIKEALNIGNYFISEQSIKFINAVLDKVAEKLNLKV